MQEKIYLSVRNQATGENYVAGCTLPVRMGKHPDSGNQILFDPKYRTISRVHGTIEASQRGQIFVDSSSNGSRVSGLVVRGSRVSLTGNFKIEIDDYVIARVEMAPLLILSTDGSLLELQRLDLLPGRGVGLSRRGSAIALLDLNRWTEWDKPVAARFETSDGQNYLVVDDDGVREGVRINKSKVANSRTLVEPLDVVELDGIRFEVIDPRERRIVCGHATCHLLNPPPYEADCRWCGRHLANTGAFSRVL